MAPLVRAQDLDDRIARELERHAELIGENRELHAVANRDFIADHEWASAHGEDANRLLAVDDELTDRDTLRRAAVGDVAQLEREPPALDRGIEHIERGMDLGPDLGP